MKATPDEGFEPHVPTPDAEARFESLRRTAGLYLAPALFLLLLILPLPGLTPEAHKLAALSAGVIALWVTEALPLAVTALLGPTLAVILGIAPAREVFAPFADPLIFVFIGSFILAQAIFTHRLNERIAFGVMSWKLIGARPSRILVAYGAIAAFLSMWISNTATAAMLLPLGLSLLAFMEKEAKIRKAYGTVLMLMTAYGSSIGGIGTPVGTPPNMIAIGMMERFAGVRIGFLQWMMFAVPIVVLFMGFLFVFLNRSGRSGVETIPGAARIIEARRKTLGEWSRGEKNVLFAFVVTVALWIIPGLLPLFLGAAHPVTQRISAVVPESVGAIVGAVLLFLLPLNRTQRSTITWRDASAIDWGTILLFGGGLALGELALKTKLADAVGSGITGVFPLTSVVTLTFAAAVFGVLISETMSNTAAANIAIPIVISIAQSAGIDPIAPAIAGSLAASMTGALPVSTPPNAIVYSSGRVPITKMIQYGLVLDLVAIIFIPILVLTLVPLVLR